MPESNLTQLPDIMLGRDPIAGTGALRDLVAAGDEGELLLFARGMPSTALAQVRRRLLSYVASRPASMAPRLYEILAGPERTHGTWAAAYLCAGLPSDHELRNRLFKLATENFRASTWYPFGDRYLAFASAGGDPGSIWHIVKADSFKWEKLRTLAFRAACVACARSHPTQLYALEEFITHEWRDDEGLVKIPNDPDESPSNSAIHNSELGAWGHFAFLEWRRGELADEILFRWASHKHYRCRMMGASVLAALGFQRTLTPLVEWLEREPVAPIAESLLHGLERVGTTASADALLNYFSRHHVGDAAVARTAWQASDHAAATEALREIVERGRSVGAEALVSLARLGIRHDRVLPSLESREYYPRLNAALALAYLGDHSIVSRLKAMQGEASNPIERIALAAAVAILDQHAAEELPQQLTLPGLDQSDLPSSDVFQFHRYLQQAILDGLAAGGEATAQALGAWREELKPFPLIAEPVSAPTPRPDAPRVASSSVVRSPIAATVGTAAPTSGSSAAVPPSAPPPTPSSVQNSRSLKAFISYSHSDRKLRENLQRHLASLLHQQLIEIWQDHEIEAGADWKMAIDQEIAAADLILLLVSPAFLDSPYCRKELVQALGRRASGATLIPILMRSCDWESVFNRQEYTIQALPRGNRPVSGGPWKNQDVAFTEIARELRKLVEKRLGIEAAL